MQAEFDTSNRSIASHIKSWLWFLVVASPVLLPAGCMGHMFYQDRQKKAADELVDQLCSKDGGLTVYEQVMAPVHYFKDKNSTPDTPREDKSIDSKDIFVYRNLPEISVRTRLPRVMRTEAVIVRRTDNKIIAKYTHYTRFGGLPFYLEWLTIYTDTYSCKSEGSGHPYSKLYINYFQFKN
jgi:hypothetical protein